MVIVYLLLYIFLNHFSEIYNRWNGFGLLLQQVNIILFYLITKISCFKNLRFSKQIIMSKISAAFLQRIEYYVKDAAATSSKQSLALLK